MDEPGCSGCSGCTMHTPCELIWCRTNYFGLMLTLKPASYRQYSKYFISLFLLPRLLCSMHLLTGSPKGATRMSLRIWKQKIWVRASKLSPDWLLSDHRILWIFRQQFKYKTGSWKCQRAEKAEKSWLMWQLTWFGVLIFFFYCSWIMSHTWFVANHRKSGIHLMFCKFLLYSFLKTRRIRLDHKIFKKKSHSMRNV